MYHTKQPPKHNNKHVIIARKSYYRQGDTHMSKVISPRSLTPQISLVSDLIDSTNKCQNLDMIRNKFLIFEAKIIKGMPLSNRFLDDKNIQGVTANGFFTLEVVLIRLLQTSTRMTKLVLPLTGEVCIHFLGSFGRLIPLIR